MFNFAAGPATLPVEVLRQVREELPDWQGSGMSAFVAVAEEAERNLRELRCYWTVRRRAAESCDG